MRKTARRFQLQPVVEGLDRRIAPSSMLASTGDQPADSTNIKVGPPPTGSGGGSTWGTGTTTTTTNN